MEQYETAGERNKSASEMIAFQEDKSGNRHRQPEPITMHGFGTIIAHI